MRKTNFIILLVFIAISITLVEPEEPIVTKSHAEVSKEITYEPLPSIDREEEYTEPVYIEEIPEPVYAEMTYEETPVYEEIEAEETPNISNEMIYTPEYLMVMGVIYWGDYRFTWYSERVLPGGGLDIPGRWSDGNFVRDGDGYLCVASSDLEKGTVLETPWGTAKVYDCGCASGTIDMYVSW